VLLEGPTGVGKAFTAEFSMTPPLPPSLTGLYSQHTDKKEVAEHMEVPLYSISAYNLMERRLDQAFGVATAWNAVILLDRLDVFLEKRVARDDYESQRTLDCRLSLPHILSLLLFRTPFSLPVSPSFSPLPTTYVLTQGKKTRLAPIPKTLPRHHFPYHQPRPHHQHGPRFCVVHPLDSLLPAGQRNFATSSMAQQLGLVKRTFRHEFY